MTVVADHTRTTGCRGTFTCIADYIEREMLFGPFAALNEPRAGELVYFIGTDDGPVKIGVSNNPAQRLEYLRTGFPYKLKLLAVAPGGRSLERGYHEFFAAQRLEGEWFARCDFLEKEIRYLRAKVRRHPSVSA